MENFLKRMHTLLNDKFNAFETALKQPATQTFRVNNLKTDTNFVLNNLNNTNINKHPFINNAYYNNSNKSLGNHYLQEFGFYYIQDASAMLVSHILKPNENDFILDLCAAPGSKTSHLASYMNNKGLIIANEIDLSRCKKLSSNIERLGIKNTIVTHTDSKNLKKHFTNFFDKIVVDAPCSGEGMFRKNDQSINTWSTQKIQDCANIQKELLADAFTMLKPNGYLIYSTCTYAKEENEDIIENFIKKFPVKIINIDIPFNVSRGINLPEAIRLYPHEHIGEGHFICLMQKNDEEFKNKNETIKNNLTAKQKDTYVEFINKYLHNSDLKQLIPYVSNDQLYLAPSFFPKLHNIHVLRYGLHLGNFIKQRFEPSHALAQTLTANSVLQSYELQEDDINKYQQGLTLENKNDYLGYTLITINSHGIGWGKANNLHINNLYPKGLRKK